MSDEKKTDQLKSDLPTETTTTRHSRSRRSLLKQIAAGGLAVGGASQILPKKWMKPVVDSVVIPVHAQSTGGSIVAHWVIGDDAPGGLVGIPVGTTNVADFLYDDGTDMHFYGTLVPPSNVTVHVNVVRVGTNYGGDDFGAHDTVAAAGVFTFPTFSPPEGGDDFGDTPGTGNITATLSAPGYANSVIRLNVAPGSVPGGNGANRKPKP